MWQKKSEGQKHGTCKDFNGWVVLLPSFEVLVELFYLENVSFSSQFGDPSNYFGFIFNFHRTVSGIL